MSCENRYDISKKVSIISLFLNTVLAVMKISVGFFFASKALIADGFHSISDIASTVVILISIKFSESPADQKHPYGHGKAEQIGTLILGFMLVFTGLALIKDTGSNILAGTVKIPKALSIWVAVISIIAKEGLYQYTVRIGKRINSKGLIADAHHHRSDAWSSIAALVGVVGARLGYPVLDPLAGLIVSIFVFKIGYDILRDAVHELMDGVPDEDKIKEFRNKVQKINGVRKVGDIKLRSYGPNFIIDLAVSVDKDLTVTEGHRVAAMVKEKLKEMDSSVEEVMVHIDPYKN